MGPGWCHGSAWKGAKYGAVLARKGAYMNLFQPRAAGDPQHLATAKTWVAEAFQTTEDTTVMVTELRCTEPGCPPLETVIALLHPDSGTRQHKIHKALQVLTRDDVLALVRTHGKEDTHGQPG